MTTPDDRAARIAALKAQRAAQLAGEPPPAPSSASPASPTPPPPPASGRREPTGRAARLITVGASSTAVLGLMTAIGIAEQPAGATAPETAPAVDQLQALPSPGTIRVPADSSVVMVVVDETGRPVDLRQMNSVAELQAFLATAEPIVAVTTPQLPDSTAVSTPVESPPQPTTVVGATDVGSSAPTSEPQSAPVIEVPAQATTTAAPTTPNTTAAPTPATTAPPVTTPVTTAPPATTPPTTVPVATPAPIVVTLPSPTPPPARGNTGGS